MCWFCIPERPVFQCEHVRGCLRSYPALITPHAIIIPKKRPIRIIQEGISWPLPATVAVLEESIVLLEDGIPDLLRKRPKKSQEVLLKNEDIKSIEHQPKPPKAKHNYEKVMVDG